MLYCSRLFAPLLRLRFLELYFALSVQVGALLARNTRVNSTRGMDVVAAIEALPVSRFHRLHLLRQMLAWSVFAMSRMRRPLPNRLAWRLCRSGAATTSP